MKLTRSATLAASLVTALGAALLAAAPLAHAQTTSATPAITILLSDQGTDGGVPYNGLVQASDGNIYGTNQCGGNTSNAYSQCITATGLSPSSGGDIFKITPAGDYSVVYSFTGGNDGGLPQGLVEAPDGNLYGVTVWDGANGVGTVFRFNFLTNTLTTIYNFADSAGEDNPLGTIIYGDDGYLYGTTVEFANQTNNGVLWRIKTDGTGYSALWNFGVSGGSASGNFGNNVQDGVTKVGSSLYGTSENGAGNANAGAVWAITTGGVGTVLHQFTNSTDGGNPAAGVKYYSDGNLYGVTYGCESAGASYGTLYKTGTASGFSTIYNATTEGCFDGRVEFDGAGNAFFGSIGDSKSGAIGGLWDYDISKSSTAQFYTFPSNNSEGQQPDSQPFIDNQGRLWTEQYDDGSGAYPGTIVAFDLSPAEAAPITISASPTSVAVNADTTIAWKSTNSFSSNEQVCFATSTPSASGWSGLQSGSYSKGILSGSKSVSFTTAGTYVLAITCGGQESALVTVKVTGGAVATTSTLTASASIIPAGGSVTLTDTVKKNSGSGVPTGTITLKSGSTVLGSGSLNGSGVFSVTASSSAYPNGTYPLTAVYGGDANDDASTSNTVNVSVADATSTALTINPTTVTIGQSVTLKATVTASKGGTPTGSVSFLEGTINLGSVPLSGGVGTAVVSSSSYPAGTYEITAVYNGDTTQAPSTSPAVKVTLSK
jgi:uncharacterized repeat protein (TIGR03803 family)